MLTLETITNCWRKSGSLETSKDTIEILDNDSHNDKSDEINNDSNSKPNLVDFDDVVKNGLKQCF